MNGVQRVIKYCAIALAVALAVGIISLAVQIALGITSITNGSRVINKYVSSEGRKTINYTETFDGVKSLDIEHSSGQLTIKSGDAVRVEAEDVLHGFTAEVKEDGRLVVSDSKSSFQLFGIDFHGIGSPKSHITIYLPQDFVAEEVLIDSGAGRITIESLQTEDLKLSNGAGDIHGQNIIADKVTMEGGVGNVLLKDVTLEDASIKCGVGNLELSGTLTGDSELDCAIGAVRLDLVGDIDDYDLKIEKGIGSVRVNDVKVRKDSDQSSIGRNPSADNSISIDGGVGEVRINIGY